MAERPKAMPTALLAIDDVAQLLGISTKTVRRLIERRDLSAIRVGSQLRIDQRDLEDFIRNQRIR